MPDRISSTKLASLLLLQKGEVSIHDILALPFVEDTEEASLIMSILVRHFDTEIEQRRVTSSVLPSWEEIIHLRHMPKPAAIS
jgi:hypothetical protein